MKAAVIGGGRWGTALAILLAGKGIETVVWDRTDSVLEELARDRENHRKLPGIPIPRDVRFSLSMEGAVAGARLVICVVASDALRTVARRLAACETDGAVIVSGIKGIEYQPLRRMSEVLEEELSGRATAGIVALSGPCLAREVALGLPTTVVAASRDPAAMRVVQDSLRSPSFRVYTNEDIVGVELAGALKNVIVLAAGMCDGLQLGENAKGALMTRGLVEITRLGVALGARATTFAGLSGMGDLITTCISRQSRNRYVGEELGRGRSLDDILSGMMMVAEGVGATRAAVRLAGDAGIDVPITSQVYAVLFEGRDPRRAVSELMQREDKPEIW